MNIRKGIILKLKSKFKFRDRSLNKFVKDFDLFKSLDNVKRLHLSWDDRYPCLNDDTRYTNFDGHYIYHPAWAARIIKNLNPRKHVDISSTLHFCSILSAFVPVEFYDYRPAILNLNNLYCGKADLTNLHFKDGTIESLSCMHTIEHIGLGRYGDDIDPDGDLKAIKELQRVCSIGGSILFVVPVGKPKIQFNAHRIYNPEMILEIFKGFELKNFSLITDKQEYIHSANINLAKEQNYGCGCFWFYKK
jgi:hypothetical protein